MNDMTIDTVYPAQANHRNAVEACASRQRFSRLNEPLVISLLRV